jgi:hypothetical protein
MAGGPVVRHERLAEQCQAVPHRRHAVDPGDRAGVVHEFKAAQARRQDARPGAVSGVDQGVRGQQFPERGVGAAAPQRMAEHEHIAAAQPGDGNPG